MNALRSPLDILSSPTLSRLRLVGCLTLGSVFLVSCAGDITPSDVRSGLKKVIGGTDEQIFIGDTLDNHYHPNVIMKRGEAYFEKEEYAEALVEYNHFMDLHRNHVLAPYAAFRIGEIHVMMAKTIDRDPEPMHKAIAAFEQMRRDFPGSRYDAQAQQKLEECHDWIAQMHLFVGQFYYRRGSYLAAAHRFGQVIKTYPDKPAASDALYYQAKAYHEMGADDWAKDNLVALLDKYPNSTASDAGSTLLEKIGGAPSKTLLAQKSDPVSVSDAAPTAIPTGSSRIPHQPSESSSPTSTIGTLGVPQALSQPSTPSADTFGNTFTACRLGAWC
ncbi:MAG: outer membrane protein assembly factor BamD [Nitrospira sp.]|nr:outer membrane protein assembly factor BamD [Nitrospira sp.]